MSPPTASDVPLCVDLDGTLIRTDLLWECVVLLAKQRPWAVLALPLWFFRGRAFLKRQLAKRIQFNAASLPYNVEYVAWLETQRALGRRLILATASDESLATAIAEHLGLFEDVVGSDGSLNVKGANKAALLERRFTEGFDYAGDSAADRFVWKRARRAIAVHAASPLVRELARQGTLERAFPHVANGPAVWAKALRVHQWSKNLLIFVPLLTSHRIFETGTLLRSILIFLAFCCCASALYIVNDLLDLTADRVHPQKRHRPFASGQLPISAGLLAATVLIGAAIAIAAQLGWQAEAILLSYAAVSLSYSMRLKSYAPLDVFLLSGLYTVRILAGGIATHIWLSGWLLSFSVFLFLSLAFTKRLAELGLLRDMNQERSTGRGYYSADLDIVRTFAVSAGFLSSLVLAFYVNSDQVRVLYREPLYLWLLFPILLYWLTKLWLLASRGELKEDPVLYAIKAPVTYWAALISLFLLLTAKFDFLSSIAR